MGTARTGKLKLGWILDLKHLLLLVDDSAGLRLREKISSALLRKLLMLAGSSEGLFNFVTAEGRVWGDSALALMLIHAPDTAGLLIMIRVSEDGIQRVISPGT